MNENIHPTTDNESSELPEAFVASFKKLLLNVSGDTDTLNTFHSMISDEIERASNPDDNSDIDLFSSTQEEPTTAVTQEEPTTVPTQEEPTTVPTQEEPTTAVTQEEPAEEPATEDTPAEEISGQLKAGQEVYLLN